MNTIKYVLTKEEKDLLENHFLHNKQNSNQDFKQFCEKVINQYSAIPFDFKKQPKKEEKDFTIDLIWDEKENITAMMYFFDHKNFRFSNSKFKSFLIFNGDLNYCNNLHQTALMLLAKNENNFSTIKSFIKNNEGFDLNIVDNENKSLHLYVLDSYNDNSLFNIDNYDGDSIKLFRYVNRIESFKNLILDWLDTNIENKVFFPYIIDKVEHMLTGLKYLENIKPKNINSTMFKEFINTELVELDKISNMLQLKLIMPEKEIKKTRMKI